MLEFWQFVFSSFYVWAGTGVFFAMFLGMLRYLVDYFTFSRCQNCSHIKDE